MAGTPQYLSPEMHLRKAYVPASSDIFAAGYILFALITCRPPFSYAVYHDDYY